MNYVLLDTNIIIDMVVDRRNQINNKLLNKFLKLLDFDEIKLVVPEIIKTETYRHLNKEINNVGKQIEKVLDDIGNLYGVSTLEMEGLDLSVYKKKARKELNDALTLFDSKREAYKADIFKSIELIFSHKNCIQIEDMYLLPSTGEKDEIDIRLRGEYEDEVWYAQVDISYGEVKLDDDGGIADAFEEGVYLEDYGIVDKLRELLNEWESFIAQEESIRESIEDIFDEVQSEDEEDVEP